MLTPLSDLTGKKQIICYLIDLFFSCQIIQWRQQSRIHLLFDGGQVFSRIMFLEWFISRKPVFSKRLFLESGKILTDFHLQPSSYLLERAHFSVSSVVTFVVYDRLKSFFMSLFDDKTPFFHVVVPCPTFASHVLSSFATSRHCDTWENNKNM